MHRMEQLINLHLSPHQQRWMPHWRKGVHQMEWKILGSSGHESHPKYLRRLKCMGWVKTKMTKMKYEMN